MHAVRICFFSLTKRNLIYALRTALLCEFEDGGPASGISLPGLMQKTKTNKNNSSALTFENVYQVCASIFAFLQKKNLFLERWRILLRPIMHALSLDPKP
jgi:hypothetical protein